MKYWEVIADKLTIGTTVAEADYVINIVTKTASMLSFKRRNNLTKEKQ
jgi:hypothetical protein